MESGLDYAIYFLFYIDINFAFVIYFNPRILYFGECSSPKTPETDAM